mgnify:CR=1 FL=1
MSSTPRTKYGEYKEKLKEWSRLFEDEYGRRPTDDDRYDSATWVALNDKARHYRRLAGEEATPSPEPEPLPPEHELWQLPRVIITPHVAARSAITAERITALVVENVQRYINGDPLLNVVDVKRGY